MCAGGSAYGQSIYKPSIKGYMRQWTYKLDAHLLCRNKEMQAGRLFSSFWTQKCVLEGYELR